MSVHLLAANPRRPVDWRWQRAVQLARDTTREFNRRRIDDEWIKKARNFRIRYTNARDDIARTALAETYPDFWYAHEYYHQDEQSDRWDLEARLLARQDPIGIANVLCTSVQTIETYERLFFNVRERIDNSGYILHHVIGPALHRGLHDREYDLLWKWYGYTYGHVMLDALIKQISDPQRPTTPSQVDAALRDDGIKSMLRKQAIATRTLPINQFTQIDLLHVYSKFVEIEKNAGENSAGAQNTIFSNIQAMLVNLPWAVGEHAHVDAGTFVEYHKDGVELRTDELMLSAVGETARAAGLPAPRFPGGGDEENG